MSNETVTVITGAFALVKDLSYVSLFAYGIRQAFAYATARLEAGGLAADLFPPAVTPESDTEEVYRKGNNVGPIGFSLSKEDA